MEVKIMSKNVFFLGLLLWSPILAHGERTVFPREFAPAEGPVAEMEMPGRAELCLNGTWQFQPQELSAGYDKKSGQPPELTAPSADRWESVPIKIPSPWNINSFAASDGKGPDFRCYPSYPAAWEDVEMGWLRRSFRVPEGWAGKRVLLRFDAVAGKAKVFINGKLAGGHFDLFLPFQMDVTDLLKPGGDNELLVGVQKASLFDHKGPYGRAPYQVGSMWGLHVAGIWQDVFLEALPAVRIDDVYIQPKVDQDELEADIVLKNETGTAVAVRLGGTVRPWKNLAGTDVLTAPEPKWTLGEETSFVLPRASVTIPAHGSTRLTLAQKVERRLKLWSPEEPNLYGLVLTLEGGDAGGKDVKYTRFGWRQFSFKGKQTLLNGKPIFFKGDAWHFMGIPELTRRYAWSWCRMLKAGKGNTLRLHAEPYPGFFLDVADEMGVMILDESAVYGSNGAVNYESPEFWQSADDEVRELVLRDRNHPSVMGWSVCNEVQAFVAGIYHSPPEIVAALKKHFGIWASTCRSEDPCRPWISADGDFDGLGELPVCMKHYEGQEWMAIQAKGSIPWGIGEQGGAYHISPEAVSKFNGERAYGSIEGRMEGLAMEACEALGWMQKNDANYRSIFNMAWYGLQPLALGLADTTRPPGLEDGIFFGPYIENKAGVQPERLGPYSTTFNPGTTGICRCTSRGRSSMGSRTVSQRPRRLLTGPCLLLLRLPRRRFIRRRLRPLAWSRHPRENLARRWPGKAWFSSTLEPALLFIDGEAPPDASARPKWMQSSAMAERSSSGALRRIASGAQCAVSCGTYPHFANCVLAGSGE